jgi:thioredoxin 1
MASLKVTDAQFEQEIIQNSQLSVVDFWAPWCGPCRILGPILEDFALKHASSIKVYKLDVDENPKTAETYGVQSIPTLVFFKNGKEVGRRAGIAQLSVLEELLERLKD